MSSGSKAQRFPAPRCCIADRAQLSLFRVEYAIATSSPRYRLTEIIGVSDRSMRRWRERYEEFGYEGLFDLHYLQGMVTIAGWSSQIVFTCGEPRLWSKSSKAIPKTSTGK